MILLVRRATMTDEKPLFAADKQPPRDAIPPPAVAAQLPVRDRKALRRKLFVTSVALWALVYFICNRQIIRELDAQQGYWLTQALNTGRPQHRLNERKVPFGKLAEQEFLSVPNPASALAASRQYATTPHLAGSEGDYKTATDFLALLQRELGIPIPGAEPVFSAGSFESRNATLGITALDAPTAWIDVYYPVMNTPLDRSLQILSQDGDAVWTAELEEVADETDPEAGKYADAVPTFHGLSRGGEAEGKLVYAHYGRKQDYDELDAKGVDLNGAIVLTRYGGIFRGLKVKGAQERGAAACLIYSDPRDDGTVTVENGYEAYPDGPARNPTSVQRGSTQFLSIYPGDPTTPGYPAYENSTRTEGTNIPEIPSLPISWANAQVLLEEIEEGGENRTIKLVNHVDDRVIPIWNTMGVIPGHIRDEVVVVGNHRDAWVMGATDPSSGTASAHEVIRGLGALLKLGWKPLRTIFIASWDAEEYGLIGSTEWGEDFADWIDEHVVAYLNLDSSVSGSRFSVSGSPSLAHFLRSAAETVAHPTKPGLTLWDARNDQGPLFGRTGDHFDVEAKANYEDELAQMAVDELGVGVLGSGSDYTVFLQRIGVASTNNGFGSTRSDPVYHYHSVFDSERWQELYADPGFLRHVAVAKFLGLQTLRLADAVVLPINTTHYAAQLDKYLDGVEQLAETSSLAVDFSSLRASIDALHDASAALDKEKAEAERELIQLARRIALHRAIKRRAREAWCTIRKVFHKPCQEDLFERPMHHPGHRVNKHKHEQDVVEPMLQRMTTKREGDVQKTKPRLGLAPARLSEERERRKREMERAGPEGTRSCHAHKAMDSVDGRLREKFIQAAKRVRAVNKKLAGFERGFIHPDGIKDREWYRHLGVAPGKWLGYGATTLPALTEAITFENNTTLVKYEADRLEALFDQLAAEIQP
ncbi:Zn-dependent exopeptidase [Rhodofomes roseus]|uniref:Zn-dependent exopeptidase n=1 Tax=Rhodofomes roseus TaxID=34475 RepID=A0ABQ8KX00_9APHY|nr:Zn-dependent exopeptidase [Rhodofomes roseus]KAH9843828.1 Zn-dependent exopeptidase [Rhodofomes roseus]